MEPKEAVDKEKMRPELHVKLASLKPAEKEGGKNQTMANNLCSRRHTADVHCMNSKKGTNK